MSRRRRLAATLAAVVGMLALSTALASPASAAGSWTAQFSGTADNLHGVSFVDAGHGWAVGNGATILATTNGGATWTAQTSGTASFLLGVSFVDAGHGWAVAGGATIVATTNGGATWTAQTSGTASFLFGVSFVDASHGWAVGTGGTIVATTNGGATWTAQTSGTASFLFGVSFVDASHGWAVGDVGTIVAFTNPQTVGTMSAGPSSGRAGTTITATSGTPCPAGTMYVTVSLSNSSGATVASTTASNLTAGGSWVGYLTVPASPAGSYAVTASCFFSAKAVLQDYNFVPFALTATPVATTTSLASSANPATYGQPVTLTATVTPQGAGTPTGTADFFSGTSGIGSASLNGVNPDRASVTITAGTPGTYSFMAVYRGDAGFTGSTSPPLTETVNKAATSLVATRTTRSAGQFSATLTRSDSSAPIAGQTVVFRVKTLAGSATLCSAVTGTTGVATCHGSVPLTASLATSHSANYAGSANYLASNATGTLS